ncbi:universal stress protein [Actinoplanes sp. NPDC049265]|uniref:universal stress protein n=1 Tax=Actinoplanes sp. NPDC049265 TaxID=3363902 RepID=UPI003715178B
MRIIVAAKPDADQPWIADAAIALAKQTSAEVTVVSVDAVELERLAAVPRSLFTQAAEHAAATMARRLTEAGVPVRHTVLSGRPADGILQLAESQNADLIVVGATTRPAVAERLLGSVPLDLVKRSTRPVVVITHPS